MKLTKFEHACFTVEKDGSALVVDPGEYTSDFVAPKNVVGVVITHHHGDHFDPKVLDTLYADNPDMEVYGTEQVEENINGNYKHRAVHAGDEVTVGPFTLKFFGGEHAVIHSSRPIDQNVGVMINDTLYYPGDSFTKPEKPVKVLALPTAAPWLKIGETIDYVLAVKPNFAFPTHDAVASDIGKKLADTILPGFAESYGGSYQRLNAPIDIDG